MHLKQVHLKQVHLFGLGAFLLPSRDPCLSPWHTQLIPHTFVGYLAHLAAFRGRLMLDVPDSASESSRGSGGGKPRPLLTINDTFSGARVGAVELSSMAINQAASQSQSIGQACSENTACVPATSFLLTVDGESLHCCGMRTWHGCC